MSAQILIPGRTCASFVDARESGLLVDGRDYFRAVHAACLAAKRTILFCGWQFDANAALLHGKDACETDEPCELIALLRECCERNPDLEVYILAWDASAVFALERQPLGTLMFTWRGHKRIHYKMDNAHPLGASTHQKYLVVDRSIAFLGGMDVCNGRWDDRDHAAECPERCSRGKPYKPYHDVQAYVNGDAVDTLRTWFAERWCMATGTECNLGDAPCEPIDFEPTRELGAPRIALARTLPGREDDTPPIPNVDELYQLHVRAIECAERLIYIENQYFSSDELTAALLRRMERRIDPPLDIVMVFPERSGGFKERISIGVYQHALLARLTAVAERTGHRLGVYYTAAPGQDGKDVSVFIHAKVLAVDDRFLLISSANTSNRSMTLDTELGIAWEHAAPAPIIRDARIDLLAEHVGISFAAAREQLADPAGLVDRLDAIAYARHHRLRIHRRNADEQVGPPLSWLLPEKDSPFDPDHSVFEVALPEPGARLDRFLREPAVLTTRSLRTAGQRMLRRVRRR